MFSIKTKKGNFLIGLNESNKVTALSFPNSNSKKISPVSDKQKHQLEKIKKNLNHYFSGKEISPLENIETEGTPFQKKVWKTLKTIPFGETRSYAWVARQIGSPKSARAVGTACGKNPIPIFIPCHRVLPANGGLGGFSSGLTWKRFLLQLEQSK